MSLILGNFYQNDYSQEFISSLANYHTPGQYASSPFSFSVEETMVTNSGPQLRTYLETGEATYNVATPITNVFFMGRLTVTVYPGTGLAASDFISVRIGRVSLTGNVSAQILRYLPTVTNDARTITYEGLLKSFVTITTTIAAGGSLTYVILFDGFMAKPQT